MRSWNAHTITPDEAQNFPADQQPRASWYAQGASDPVGDRLLMFDNSRGPSLELLRFSWRVAGSSQFEDALRERVDVLSHFSHEAFAKIRAVEKLDPDKDLTLVSNYVQGKRLSESFAALRGPVFAMWVIRELLPALADLQQFARGMAHGALTPDRVVLTPEGRLVLVEHVLGSALERLQLAPEELWLRFGIAAHPADGGTAVLDARADVFQLGLIAVAVLLGRPVASHEYPDRLHETLDAFERSTGREIPSSLRSWLVRALGLGGPPFQSARDARNGLGELHAGHPHNEGLGAGMFAAAARSIERSDRALQAAEQKEPPPPRPVWHGATAKGAPGGVDSRAIEPHLAPKTERRRHLVAALVALVIVQAAYIGYLLATKAPAVVVARPQAALSVAGIAPAAPATEAMTLQALAPAPPASRPETPREPVRVRSGGVRLVSPIEIQVLEGDRVLGSSADGPIVASAGRHEFELVNSVLGYRVRRVVNITAGEVISLSLPHPEGRVSINAVPWADVWIDDVHVGETPLANLSVPIGQHEVSFRHPSFGERKQTAVIRHDTPARISADLR